MQEQKAGEEIEVFINLPKFCLQLLEKGKVIKSYPIAIGAKNTPTPVGDFKIIAKAPWGGAFGTRWMGLDVPWGTYGIHGTRRPESIGNPVSHGCIRMFNFHAEELYDRVSVNTRVKIVGPINLENLAKGSTGNLVCLVQEELSKQGLYEGPIHGIFDEETEEAVGLFQKENNLLITRVIHSKDLEALGITVK